MQSGGSRVCIVFTYAQGFQVFTEGRTPTLDFVCYFPVLRGSVSGFQPTLSFLLSPRHCSFVFAFLLVP